MKGAVAVLLLLAPVASAQPREDIDSLYGCEISAGGGVVDFTGDAAQHLTKAGGLWDVRLLVGANTVLGFEMAYSGTVNSFNDVMAPLAPGSILGSSLEGTFRLQIPRPIAEQYTGSISPFGFVGAGWNNYTLTDSRRDTAAISSSDNMFLLPWGVGVEGYLTRTFALDARFTYRAMFDDHMLHTSATGVPGVPSQNLGQWAVSARAIYTF